MFHRRRRDPEETKPDALNMTPMIDIVFQLLIFFMLSMHFKEVEGKLLSQLPKNKGPDSRPAPFDPREVRVVLCAGGDWRTHLQDKGRHEKADKNGSTCTLLVEQVEIGQVFASESQPARAPGNRSSYRALAAKARELYTGLPPAPGKPAPPIIVDADSEVPYEHIIGVVNACKEAGLETIEFVANPRHDRYYGSHEKGQFQRDSRK